MQLRNRKNWEMGNYILDHLGRVTSIIDSTFGSHTYTYNNNPIEYDTVHKFLMTKFNEYEYSYQGKRLVTVTKNNKTISYTY